MASARAWRPRAVAKCWPPAAPAGASGSAPERRTPRLAKRRTKRAAKRASMERLRRRTDFRAAAAGLRASGAAFAVQARRRAEDGPARIGFTVSRQVGHAVERNRVRRRLREMVRLTESQGSLGDVLRGGHDYVLIGRRAALAMAFGEMRRQFDAALIRIHDREQALPARSDAAPGTGGKAESSLHQAGSPRQRRPRRSDRQPPNA